MEKNFTGIIPALLTPFHKSGQINHVALRQLIRLNLRKGVHGFYVGGSTGEGFLMSTAERKELFEAVVNEVNGRATVIAQVGSMTTKEACDLAIFAEKCGADAVSSVAPFYYPYTYDEIKAYYHSIAGAVRLPVIIYNFPKLANVTLTPDAAKDFMTDQFIGIKHTSNDFYALERFKQIRDDLLVYNGYDEMLLSGLVAGADGGIGSTYNFMAEKFIALYQAYLAKELDTAQCIQKEVNDIIDIIIPIGVLQSEKAILQLMGIDMGDCRPPFKALNKKEIETLKYRVINKL